MRIIADPSELRIEKAIREDRADIIAFLNDDFLRNEPLNAAMGIEVGDVGGFFHEIVDAALAAPLSYTVRNSNGEIVGLRLGAIIRRPLDDDQAAATRGNYEFRTANENTWKMRPLQRLLSHLEGQIWRLVPTEIHTLLNWLVLSVRHDYTRRGLARRLIEHNWEEARALGCQGFVAEATAFNSQKLFALSGYERLYAVELSEWRDALNQPIFKCSDGTTKATLEFLPLRKP